MTRELDLPFSREEYAGRLEKTRAAMEAGGIELLVVTDPSNMAWLTGYDGWSFYVHQCVLVGPDGDPLWFGRGQDRNGALRTAYMSEDRLLGYADHFVQSTERHPMQELARQIEARGWAALAIGTELDNYYFSAKCQKVLEHDLPNARFVDATALVNWRRAVKSETELLYMGRAARIVEAQHARILELIEPGLAKNRLVAEIMKTAIDGADGHGGDYPAIVPLTPSGVDASAAHLTWNEKPFKAGEGTFFEIAGCYRRYHCPLSRTIFLGQPDQLWLDTEKAVLEGIEAALDAARPGNACEDVETAWRKTMAKHGIEKGERCGYPIGLSYPPDWGERTMSLRPGDRTVLQENMTFHFIPAIWRETWGLEITESFVVTASGGAPFCNYPRKLLVKDVGPSLAPIGGEDEALEA